MGHLVRSGACTGPVLVFDEVWHRPIRWPNQQNVPDRCALGSVAGTMAKGTRETLATTRFPQKMRHVSHAGVPDLGTLATAQKKVERATLNSFLIA